MEDAYLHAHRQRLIEKYKLTFVDGRAPIHKRVYHAYIRGAHRYFTDAGIRLVLWDINAKKIGNRGYWEYFTPAIGAKPIAKERQAETDAKRKMLQTLQTARKVRLHRVQRPKRR